MYKIYHKNGNLLFEGANLRGVDLRWADLQEADLRWVDLRGTNLRGANLQGADMQGADMRGADLRWADLRGADLEGVNLRWADLRWANLREASLEGTSLEGANLQGVIGNGREILTIQCCYPVVIFNGIISIGCQQHSFKKWAEFSDNEILKMDDQKALEFWKSYGKGILSIAENHTNNFSKKQ